jgi:membrane-associated phospholipid phosphatase
MQHWRRCFSAAAANGGGETIPHGRSQAWFVAGAAAAALAALGTALGYHALFVPLNALAAGWPDTVLESITDLGDSLVALAALLFFVRHRPRTVRLGVIAGILSALLSRGLKSILALPRPAAVLPLDSFHLTGPALLTRGFPSGHTVTAFVAALVFGWFEPRRSRRLGWLALAAGVGWSRIGAGAHWPLDVLGGILVAGVSVLLAAPLAQRWAWAETPAGRATFTTLLCACAVALLFYQPLYPLGVPLVRTIAVAALGSQLWALIRAHGEIER